MNSISITIPLEPAVITRTIDMLNGLLADIDKDYVKSVIESVPTIDKDDNGGDDNNVVVNAADKFGGKAPDPRKTTETPPPPGGDTSSSITIELDGDGTVEGGGLPWDVRIHGAAKKKTAKDNKWKYIKNIEKNKPGLIAQVEAELRASLAANPVVTDSSASEDNNTQTPPPPPPADTPPPPVESVLIPEYLVDGKLYTADQLRASNWTDDQINKLPPHETSETIDTSTTAITFPEFMGKVTAALANGTLTQVQVDTALNAEKLASMPLLSARQDLVPKIHAALFPNG